MPRQRRVVHNSAAVMAPALASRLTHARRAHHAVPPSRRLTASPRGGAAGTRPSYAASLIRRNNETSPQHASPQRKLFAANQPKSGDSRRAAGNAISAGTNGNESTGHTASAARSSAVSGEPASEPRVAMKNAIAAVATK